MVQQPLSAILDNSNTIANDVLPSAAAAAQPLTPSAPPLQNTQTNEERQRYQSHLQLQLNQIQQANQMGVQHMMHGGAAAAAAGGGVCEPVAPHRGDPMKYQRNFVDGEFEFVWATVFFSMNYFH